ncbi:MAG: 3-dehydroquinate synthase [Candidatus Eremiobacteraeota bacterium]|nr:3-dehydroquinate synthase [Candidatus Eremiobacteraeota bacterium]
MTRFDDLGYPIVIAGDVPRALATFLRERGARRIVLLADRRIAAHAERIRRALRGASAPLLFTLSERRKTLKTLEGVLDALAAAKADRETIVVGIGGGVATDLFGFAAASYMRGIPFVAVATSLVGMVDAAVGGKTGVDLRAGKNLAGAFRDPIAVFCDLAALATLREAQFREGMAEVVKHGVIEGGETFEALETLAPHPFKKWPWEKVVADSIRVKAMYVADDRLELGARETLNLGHTFAHAFERATRYALSHGEAVAIGLRGAGLLALRTGRFSEAEHLRVLSLLALLGLPLESGGAATAPVVSAMSSDKKSRGGALRFVLPRALGDVETGVIAAPRSVRAVIERLRTPPGAREFR